MALLLEAVVALVPLLIAPGLLFYFDVTPKVVVLMMGAGAALLVSSGRRRCPRALAAMLALFWISLAASTLWSVDPWLSFGGTNWRRLGLITWTAILVFTFVLAGYLRGQPMRVRRLLRVIAVSGSLAAAYGALQFFGWDPWLPAAAYHIGEGVWTIVRPPGPMGYATYFATYLLTVLFAGLALSGVEASRGWRLAGLAAAALAAWTMLLTGTRGALLGLAAGLLLLALWRRPRVHRTAVAAAVLAGLALAAFYYSPAGQKLRSRARWYVEDRWGGPRLLLWRDSVRMAAAHWALGFGPETFSSEFPQFQSAELSRGFPDFYHESPHNIFLDIVSGQGLAGLAILVSLIGWGLAKARQAHREEPRLAALLASALVAVLVSQQFSALTMPTALFLFVNLALLAALERGALPDRFSGRRRLLQAGSLVVAACLAFFAVRLLAADRLLATAQAQLASGRLAEAATTYGTVLRWQPPGMNADIWYSRAMAAAGSKTADLRLRLQAWQEAVRAADRATRTAEDRQNAWYNLAVLCAANQDVAGTERSLRQAIAVSPHWYKPRWTLAQLLRATGRLEEASRQADIAADLNGKKHPAVEATADEIRAQSRRGP